MTQIDGRAVRRARELAGFTTEQFATRLEISASYLRMIERGERTLDRRPDLRKRIADETGFPAGSLERRDAAS